MSGTAASPSEEPDLRLLGVFVAVAEASSFSKAAIKLGVTKATVSRSIRRLEAELGVELLHRTTHRVAMSTAGTALYERSAAHIHALSQALRALPERDQAPSGTLRVTAPHDFGATVLAELVARFRLRHPQVAFDIRLSNDAIDLVAEGFDVAIRVGANRLADSSLIARKLGQAGVRYYASPSYLARRGEPRQAGDPKHEWIEFARGLESPGSEGSALRCDDLTLVSNLVLADAGIGVLPSFIASPHVARGSLVPVLPGLEVAKATLFFVYPSSGQVPRKVIAFRDFVVAALRSTPRLG